MIRLQGALAQLGFYHGPVDGDMSDPTKRALKEFLSRVPAKAKSQYGTEVARMAEAAARHELTLNAK